ncbi:MAG: universal stress protein [Candidatus Marinimicrobia bacterium]|nr:universal stress protein [Candidatus Neomarinimicrobiota bacterium]
MTPDIKTIVYATGLGGGAPHVFRYALSLARQYQAKIEIVCGMASLRQYSHEVAEIYLGHDETEEFHQQARDRIKLELEGQVESMCKSAIVDDPDGYQYVNSINVIEDSPDQAILQYSEKIMADMIVMGTHRKTTRRGSLLGSCAFKVVHESTIPVLLVRIPEGFKDLPHKSDAPAVMTS